MGWTAERVATLTRLWLEGCSGAEIARTLGGGATRNAVIAKVWRLGLGRSDPSAPPMRAPVKAGPKGGRRKAVPPKAPAPPKVKPRPANVVELSVPRAAEGQPACKWPIGEPGELDFTFCGGVTVQGRPYCAPHCKRAGMKQTPKAVQTMGGRVAAGFRFNHYGDGRQRLAGHGKRWGAS